MQDWNEQVFKPIFRGDGWVSENNENEKGLSLAHKYETAQRFFFGY